MSDAAAVIKDCIIEFSRIQNWMLQIKEAVPETYDSMYQRYLELKVILTSLGVNLAELDKIK